MNCLYHRVPDRMVGKTLYPLNSLRRIDPSAAAAQERKYDSRKHLMQVRIPILDCLWNDVLHLSPLHPAKIKEALVQTDNLPAPSPLAAYFVIDPASLAPGKAVYFRHSKDTQEKYDFLEADFMPFDPSQYQELAAVTQEQLDYFRRMKVQGLRPLLWARTPHVFYKGTIDTSTLTIIQW